MCLRKKLALCVRSKLMHALFAPKDEDVLFRFAILSPYPSCDHGAVPNPLVSSALVSIDEIPFI